MGQLENIRAHKKRSELGTSIQRCYEKYLANDDTAAFEELIVLLDKYCQGRVTSVLVDYCEDIEDVMQEARLAIFRNIRVQRQTGATIENFGTYAFRIYMNKAADFLRKRKQLVDSGSFDDINQSTAKGLSVTNSVSTNPEDTFYMNNKQELYNSYYKVYCTALTQAADPPSNSLALFFARILPHMLQIDYGIDTISEEKPASVKWAFERMGEQTVGKLSESAEHDLKWMVDENLSWCAAHRHQLNALVSTEQGEIMIRNTVYTKNFNIKSVYRWADEMHKKVAIEAYTRLFKLQAQKKLAVEYISGKHDFLDFMEGGA